MVWGGVKQCTPVITEPLQVHLLHCSTHKLQFREVRQEQLQRAYLWMTRQAQVRKYRGECTSTDMLCSHTSSLHQQLDLQREWLYKRPLRLLLTLILHTEDIRTYAKLAHKPSCWMGHSAVSLMCSPRTHPL